MEFNLLTLVGIGVAVAAFLLYRRSRGGPAVEEDSRAAGQRRDVLRAIESMRKD